MVLSTHSQTHLWRTFFRVGQTPRRAVRLTQSIVGAAVRRTTIAARSAPAFGRPAEAGRRAGGGERLRMAGSRCDHARARKLPEGRGRCQAERRGAAPGQRIVSLYIKMCMICTILATLSTLPEWVVAYCKASCALFARILAQLRSA